MKTDVDEEEDKRRLSEENMDEFIESVRQFRAGMAASMGSDRLRDIRDSVHRTGAGAGAR